MGRYDGYLILADYDGTLADRSGQVSPENVEAIKQFQREGGFFTIASGRSPDFIRNVAEKVPLNAPVIALNGGAIVDPESFEVIERIGGNDEFVRDYLSLIDPEISFETHLWHSSCVNAVWKKGEGDPESSVRGWEPPVYKAIFVEYTPELALELKDRAKARFGDKYLIERSWPVGLEMLPAFSGKGNAAKLVKRLMGGRVHTLIGMGDYENDVSLLSAADIGVAVGNALENVKQAADKITVPNHEHAVRQVILELLA
ncbi:MAG: HAD family hydrolase [Clostridia bacterium]|nr:HAD family hydrolase [Clostridia bacterium]MCR4577937.1 HAD family hydrolase [Clostridiales bacterium]